MQAVNYIVICVVRELYVAVIVISIGGTETSRLRNGI